MTNYYDKKAETMSASEKENLQSEKLIKTVKLAYERVPIYREKMKKVGLTPADIKSIRDISKLPYTVKQDLRDSYPFGMFATDRKNIVRVHASSATTGKLTVVGYTKYDLDVWSEAVARAIVSAGGSQESIIHVAFGYGLFTGGLGLHYGAELLGANVVPASGGNTKRQLMLMKDFGTDILCCTPSYAVYLAEEMSKYGYSPEDFNLKAGIFGAEAWSEEMRKTIESKLKIKAYDIYGLSEITGPGVASECEYQEGMHVQDDYFYPEVVDKDSLEPIAYGEEGELVFTTLDKEGMPLIRYRTRDLASLNNTPCKCGRTSVRLNKITGRTDDMLIIRGVNVFPSQIESVLLNRAGVEPHYHINVDRVNNLDTIEIQVEMSEELMSDEAKVVESLRAKLAEDMASAIGISAKLTLVSPHSLARSEGKSNRITDYRKLK